MNRLTSPVREPSVHEEIRDVDGLRFKSLDGRTTGNRHGIQIILGPIW